MARAWLRDDPDLGYADRPTQYDPVTVSLDDDLWCPPSPGSPSPEPGGGNQIFYQFEVFRRVQTGLDDNDNPTYDWALVTTQPTITYTERSEWDAVAGQNVIRAVATMRYEGPEDLTETAIARRSDGTVWRVVGVHQQAGTVVLDLRMLDQQPEGDGG